MMNPRQNGTATQNPNTAATFVFPQEGWDGPTVELRPTDAGSEWPEKAVARVRFSLANVANPSRYIAAALPFDEYFGEDGWALTVPQDLKARLDPRMRIELVRYPWTCHAKTWSEASWLYLASSYEKFVLHNARAGRTRRAWNLHLVPKP